MEGKVQFYFKWYNKQTKASVKKINKKVITVWFQKEFYNNILF